MELSIKFLTAFKFKDKIQKGNMQYLKFGADANSKAKHAKLVEKQDSKKKTEVI